MQAERRWERRWFNGDYPSWKRACAVNKMSGLAGTIPLQEGTMSPQPDALITIASDQSRAGPWLREAVQGGEEVV